MWFHVKSFYILHSYLSPLQECRAYLSPPNGVVAPNRYRSSYSPPNGVVAQNQNRYRSSYFICFSFQKRKGYGRSSLQIAWCLKRVARSLTNSSGGGATSNRSFLPQEFLESVLVRLPAKSILRFKSVCKTWRSLFDSRFFIDSHCSRVRCDNSIAVHSSTVQHLLNMAPELRVVRSPDLRLPYLSQNWRRLICAYGPLDNGIYGLTSLLGEISTGRYFLTGKIGFCNPATRDYKLTNPFPYSLVSETRFFLDPIFANFGFGSVRQDSGMVDHKVVVLISRKPFSSYIGFVYSLQSGEWKKLVDYELDDNKAFHVVPVPLVLCPEKSDLKGHWHWLAKTKPPHDLSNQPFVVLSFDFADEVFKIIGGPPCDYDDSKNYVRSELLVLHDHLVVIYVHEVIMHSWCVEINAWMMMEYGVEESWTMIYKIQPNCFGRLSRLVGIDSYPVRDEETSVIHIERLSFEDQYHEKTIIFNKDGFKAVEGCKSYSDIYWNIAGISTYMETLEPLRTCFANGKNLLEEGKDTQRRISKDICEKYKGKRILDTTDNPAGSLTSDGVEDSGNKQTTLGDKVIKMGMISPEDS